MNRKDLFLLLGAVIAPLGCTMAPKYTRPTAPVPAAWPTGAAYAQAAETNAPSASDLGWRQFFTDEKLRQVIGASLTNNLDLRVAALNVELARAMYGIQRASLLPTLDANGSLSKAGTPADLSSTGKRQTSTRYDANLGSASWEIDFFGRIRSLKDQAGSKKFQVQSSNLHH